MNSRYRQAGFSLIELLVVVSIFTIVIIAASQSFVPLLSQSKQQSKIAATNIEGMLGLEVMRRDIAHAGYGLYWGLDPRSAPTISYIYTEITPTDVNGAALNDAPSGIPRALVVGSGRGLNGSDRIAIKAVNVATNEESERWTYLYVSPTLTVLTWWTAAENIPNGDYVIAVRPEDDKRTLLFTKATADPPKAHSTPYSGVTTDYDAPDTTSIIFSLGTTSTPKMAFNRADYLITNTNVPPRCAPGTGVLYKAVVNQIVGSPGFLVALPQLDCVADMQVGYRYDNDKDGYADSFYDPIGDEPVDAESARQIREVRVYILAQEGQMDRSYTYPNNIVTVGEKVGGVVVYGRDFDFAALGIGNWQNYRWKLYTIIVETMNLVDWVTP
jgi:prepilin-type N-terminal cleavage/methylation domain-containing protein